MMKVAGLKLGLKTVFAAVTAVSILASQYIGQPGSLAHWGPTIKNMFDGVESMLVVEEPPVEEVVYSPRECERAGQKNCLYP